MREVEEFKGEHPFRDKPLTDTTHYAELESYFRMLSLKFDRVIGKPGLHVELKPEVLEKIRGELHRFAKENKVHVVLTPKPGGDLYHLALFSPLPYKNQKEFEQAEQVARERAKLKARFDEIKAKIEKIDKERYYNAETGLGLLSYRRPSRSEAEELCWLADRLGYTDFYIRSEDGPNTSYRKKSNGQWKKL